MHSKLKCSETRTDQDISDYDVFLSPLEDFKAEVEKAGLQEKTVYLDRGDEFRFEVRQI